MVDGQLTLTVDIILMSIEHFLPGGIIICSWRQHDVTLPLFMAQIDGNIRGYKDFNSTVNTNLNVRHNTQDAFILHTLDAQWTSTTL